MVALPGPAPISVSAFVVAEIDSLKWPGPIWIVSPEAASETACEIVRHGAALLVHVLLVLLPPAAAVATYRVVAACATPAPAPAAAHISTAANSLVNILSPTTRPPVQPGIPILRLVSIYQT